MSERIGVTLELDGEKQYKQAVSAITAANKSLDSELKLIESRFAGNANSMEALSEKHKVLEKRYESQDKAVKTYQAALKSAEKQEDEAAEAVKRLQRSLQDARDKMEEMKTSSTATNEEISQQEDEIARLEGRLSSASSSYLNAERNTATWQRRVNEAQVDLNRINAEIQQNGTYLEEARNSADQTAHSIDEFGNRIEEVGENVEEAGERTSVFGDVLKANLVTGIIEKTTDLMKEAATAAWEYGVQFETSASKVKAATGATAGEMQGFEKTMKSLYVNDYGESFDDIAEALTEIKQQAGSIDPSKLEETAENAISLRDTFGFDYQEQLRAVNALMSNFGLTSEEAYNLIVQGAQNGLNKNGDLLDTINEYSVHYSQMGLTADEFFNSLANGTEAGTFSVDKLGDAYKEFGIRVRDTASSTTEGFELIGKNADIMRGKFAQGGESAREATKEVLEALFEMDNVVEQNQAGVDLFGTMWEDLGKEGVAALMQVNGEMSSTYDAMDRLKNVRYDNLESRLATLGRTFQDKIGTPLAEDFFPIVEDGMTLLIENSDGVIAAIKGVGVAVAGLAVVKTVTKGVEALTTATQGAAAAQEVMNLVAKANPYILLATAVAGAVTAVIAFANGCGEASKDVELLTEANNRVVESANEVADATQDTISGYAESKSQMEAEAKYADILSGKIKDLAAKENKSNAEKEVMKGYVSELNSLVPNLNLAYDAQADSLNMSNEAIEKQLRLNEEQVKQQAALEYAQELIKKKTELEIEEIKLANESSALREKQTELENEHSDAVLNGLTGLSALVAGESDARASYQEVTEAQELNSEALENNRKAKEELAAEEEAAMEVLAEYGYSIDGSTGQVQSNTGALDENSESVAENSEAQRLAAAMNSESVQSIAETYNGMQETLKGVLDSQMNMFEEFNAGTEISSEKLLKNMQSQINGVTAWADNMSILADRGVNQGILDKLAEMGPQGASYVQAFAQMSDDQLKQANEMWLESIDMKEGVQGSVQGMLESYTEAVNGGKEQVTAAMQSIGENSVQGLVDAVNQNAAQAQMAAKNLGQGAVDGAAEGAGTHSPSWKTAEIGSNMDIGLINGINDGATAVQQAFSTITENIIKNAKTALNESGFRSIGQSVVNGIQTGIQQKQTGLMENVKTVSNQIKNTLQIGLMPAVFVPIGAQVGAGLTTGITLGTVAVKGAGNELKKAAIDPAKELGRDSLYSTGLNVSYGLAEGIRDGKSDVVNAVSSMCAAAISKAKSKLQIHSPSKVFGEMGEYSAEGYGLGYKKRFQDVNRMIEDSLSFGSRRSRDNWSVAGSSVGQIMLEIEQPIYIDGLLKEKRVTKSVISGITRKQTNRMKAKGVGVSAV